MKKSVEAIQSCITNVYKAIQPITLIAWMKAYFWISALSSNTQGQRFKVRGYQLPFLHLMWDLDIRMLVLVKGTQQGATQCANGFALYEPIHRRRSLIYYLPRNPDVTKFATINLKGNIQDMAVVRSSMIADPDSGRHDSDNTSARKAFHGGQLHILSAGVQENFRQVNASTFIFDETDGTKFSVALSAKQEGVNPLDLAWGRVSGAMDKKGVYLSTPTEEGTSNIMYMGKRCEVYMVFFHQCPKCGHHQELTWNNGKEDHGFTWDQITDDTGRRNNGATAATVRYVCEANGCEFTHTDFLKIDKDPSKQYLRQKVVDWDSPKKTFQYGDITLHWDKHGKFQWKRDGVDMISKPKSVFLQWRGWFSYETAWDEITEMYLNGVDQIRSGDPSPLRRWTQEVKSEVWVEQGGAQVIRHGYLMARQKQSRIDGEPWMGDRVPDKVQFIVHTCDVQKDRVEVLATGFGDGMETFLIRKYIVHGDVITDESVLKRIQEMTEITYTKGRGENAFQMPVYLTAIDAKYQTDIVNAACEGEYKDIIIPMIGTNALKAPLIMGPPANSKKVFDTHYTSMCTDTGKDRVYQMYKVESPGPGYVHISQHESFDEDTIKQLVAEHKVIKGMVRRWWPIKTGSSVEMFDMLYIALALVEFAKTQYGLEILPASEYSDSIYTDIESDDDQMTDEEIAEVWA